MKRSIIKKTIGIIACGAFLNICAAVFVAPSDAYWVWTPETKKFINPKYAVKDTPKEQFDWAMGFYDAKDYNRAATEFDKLTKHYEFSEYAPKAQYYAGLSYENMGKYYIAFQNYQKAIDNFPHIENMDEINAREFNIAGIYAKKDNPKILGTDIMTSTDRAIEIYRKVAENAPFGPLADKSQFKMGEALKGANRYEEATLAFQKIIDDYPDSELAAKAQYEVAYCAYRASLQPAYDAGPTDRAIQIFEEFAASSKDTKLSEEAAATMKRLKDKAAEKSMLTARFYEQQNHPKSAIIYYQDVLDRYPDSVHAAAAKAKIEQLSVAKPRQGMLGGMLTYFKKKSEPAPVTPPTPEEQAAARKKGWSMFGWFGKKVQGPAPQPAGASAAFDKAADKMAQQAAATAAASPRLNAPGNIGMLPVAALQGPAAAASSAAVQGGAGVAAPVASGAASAATAPITAGAMSAAMPETNPALYEPPPNPLAFEATKIGSTAPRTDDPNVEIQDDDRI